MTFKEALKIKQVLRHYKGTWMIAGGWAIDLYLNKVNRFHQDIEIAIPRTEQNQIQKFLKDWTFQYVKAGKFHSWKTGEQLDLPIHEIHGTFEDLRLEILLNEIEDHRWKFRRNLGITYPLEKVILSSQANIPILCPEIVLLCKAKIKQAKDKMDLLNALGQMEDWRKTWLMEAIQTTHGNKHEWIEIIRKNTNVT